MPRIALLPPRRAGPELKAAYRRIDELWAYKRRTPFVKEIMQCFCHRPDYVEPVARGYHFVGWAGRLPRAVRELVAVLVSRENDCFY